MTAPSIEAPRLRPLLTTAAYYTAMVTLGLTSAVLGPTLPWLARHTHSRLDQLSFIFVACSLGYLIGSLLGGWAYDHFPVHRVQVVVLWLIAATAALVPVLPLLVVMALVLFILGMAQGGLDVGCNTLITWVHGSQVGPFMNGLHFFFGVGAFLSPLIVARVITATGEIHWVFWIFALLAILTSFWLWNLPGPLKAAQPSGTQTNKVSPTLIFFFMMVFALYVGAEVGFGNWIFTYTTRLGLSTETMAAYLTSAFWGSFTLGRLLGVGISTRLRPQTILYIDIVGCLASLGIILSAPASQAALWGGTLSLGLFMASFFATALALADQRMHLTGSITSWLLVGAGLGGMFLPWLIGQLFERIGPEVTMLILFADLSTALGLLIFLNLRYGHLPQKGTTESEKTDRE